MPSPPRLRVLVVDDDADTRRFLAEALAAATDIEVCLGAATLADGLRRLREVRPDVLLVDLGLPDGSGIELIRHAAVELPGCDVMVVSVFGDETTVLASIEAGATGYLLKDSSADEIVEQVRVLRGGGSPISPVIARRLLRSFGAASSPAPPAGKESDDDTAATGLSPRERDVLRLSAKGYSYEEIAPLLGVSRHTVTSFVKRIYRKLQVHSKGEALFAARGLGWLADE